MKANLFFVFSLFIITSCRTKTTVDLIVTNAHVFTVNNQFDMASTIVIQKGKIVAVGNDSLLSRYEAVRQIDAKGQYIYPGFIDAHCHFTGAAMDSYKLKLFGTKSFHEVVRKCVDYAKTSKKVWIEGSGWDQNDWNDQQFPNKDTLDKLFPDRPVFLLRVDGHAALVNQKALDLAGITTSNTTQRGEFEVKNGKLTGLLIDHAMQLVRSKLPIPEQEEATNYFVTSQHDFFKTGLTSIVECGVNDDVIHWLKAAYKQGILQLRTTMMLNADQQELSKFLSDKPYQSEQLHVAGFKVFMDGSLGSRGAFLKEDYSDRAGHKGTLLLSPDSLRTISTMVYSSQYQLCAHAIGDGANGEVLDIYSSILKTKNDRRWRIEHAQVIHADEMHLFGDFSIIPSVQPTHATSDMYWATDRLGELRMKDAYAYKQLLQQNHWLPLGTDYPVEHLNPVYTFYAAVFRMDKEQQPQQGFQIENALSREEALRGITIWAAKSVFEETMKGSLEPGKFADFVILDTDLMKADASHIYNANILSTYLNGVEVYHK